MFRVMRNDVLFPAKIIIGVAMLGMDKAGAPPPSPFIPCNFMEQMEMNFGDSYSITVNERVREQRNGMRNGEQYNLAKYIIPSLNPPSVPPPQ